jgi:2,3-bisphosphoglycerate-independent phosphoglycerate mutase
VWVHAVTDGRDVADGTARLYLDRVARLARQAGTGRVASVIGRGYALDKAGDHALTTRAAAAITDGDGVRVGRAEDALGEEGDEWVVPSVVTGDDGQAMAPVRNGDALLFFNFRSDRIQQLADHVVEHCAATDRDVTVLSLAQYDTRALIPALVERADATGGLADELAAAGLRSVRIAEAEKFEHVTYYVNGRDGRGREVEEHRRITGDGPPDYRKHPEMNADLVADAVIEAIARDGTDLVIANVANIDVVGHTGDFDATVRAAEHTDAAVARIVEAARLHGRWVLLVGDHGNAESMTKTGPDGRARPYGGHTTNPVPVVLVPAPEQRVDGPHTAEGTLADVAPTVLHLLGREPGPRMTGSPLFTGVPGARVAERERVRALLGSLSAALLGAGERGVGLLPPQARAAFAPDAVCRPLSLAGGAWAVLRTAPGTNDRVLCVHNPTDTELDFAPADVLADDPSGSGPLVHLRGQMETLEGRADGILCRLRPHEYVWLGRFTTEPPGRPGPR